MILILLTSCGNTDTNTPSDITTQAETEASTDVADDIIIVDNGKSEYTLIRSDSSESEITNSMLSLKNAINEVYGATLAVKTDWEKGVANNAVIENNNKEILIGNCNRKEAQDVYATLSKDEYKICIVNNKLVIVGYDFYSTQQAVELFISKYLKTSGTTLKLSADMTENGESSVQKIALTKGADLRVMSFNILGSGNEYATRKQYEIQAILDYLPDVIGFQEANSTTHSGTLMSSALKSYYDINAKTHTNSSTVNYTAILYLKDKYTLVEGGVEWLNSRYTKTNTKSLSWAVLEVKTTGQRFIVVNIHGALWSSTYDLPAGETYQSMRTKALQWRVDNVNQILEKIKTLKTKYGDIPAVTTGDYNFDNTTEAYSTMIKAGMADSQVTATVSSTTNVGSYHSVVGEMPATGGRAIDHVFYSPEGFSALKFVISTRADDLKASDHCPVFADIKFIN